MVPVSRTIKEIPANGSTRRDFLVVPNKLDLGPEMALEPAGPGPAQVGGAIEPVRSQKPDRECQYSTRGVLSFRKKERGLVVPLHIVESIAELRLKEVQIPATWPVVPEIVYLELSCVCQVDVELRVELKRPGGW